MKGELILSRAEMETIVVDSSDGPICITVVAIRGGKVRLGVAAPPRCPVMRGELRREDGSRFDAVFYQEDR
jgi:carbon storage regulator CsrA